MNFRTIRAIALRRNRGARHIGYLYKPVPHAHESVSEFTERYIE